MMLAVCVVADELWGVLVPLPGREEILEHRPVNEKHLPACL